MKPDVPQGRTRILRVQRRAGDMPYEMIDSVVENVAEDKRRSARSAYLTGAELTRRCWDALGDATW